MTTKKKTAKKATKKTETIKELISARQIGRNVILIIEGKKYSKSFPVKEDRDQILSEVEAFNKRNTKTKKKSIVDVMTSHLKKEDTKKANKKKVNKKPVITKKLKESELEKAKKLLEKEGFNVTKIAKPSARQRGEY